MGSRREYRSRRVALFDGIEEGGVRAMSSYSSHKIDEHDNDRAMDGLQDRVNILKRLTGGIHEEVDAHNRMLDRMGNDMDSSRGILPGNMDKFKQVFETKSSGRMLSHVASFVVIFLIVYYLTRKQNLFIMVTEGEKSQTNKQNRPSINSFPSVCEPEDFFQLTYEKLLYPVRTKPFIRLAT